MLRALPYGDRAWLVECPPDEAFAVALALRTHPWQQPPEIVVGAATCLVRFPAVAPGRGEIEAAIARLGQRESESRSAAVIEVPVAYSGDDLQFVADHARCSVTQVIALHTAATYRVAFLGFSPGFAYLQGLPQRLQIPRRAVPRLRVPPGSVAIADRYSAVYPGPSPGGWHLIGSTEVRLFDPERQPASLLRPGVAVKFREVR